MTGNICLNSKELKKGGKKREGRREGEGEREREGTRGREGGWEREGVSEREGGRAKTPKRIQPLRLFSGRREPPLLV